MRKIAATLLVLLCFCLGCSLFDAEIAEYVAVREGNGKLQPVAKVVYKVMTDRQEVVYWIERPNESRGQLYRLQHCIVVDVKNWEGYCDSSSPLPFTPKVEFVNGKFGDPYSVSWWTWHFDTDPKPSNLAEIAGGIVVALLILEICVGIKDWLTNKRETRNKGTTL
jgi:hypothetical protein